MKVYNKISTKIKRRILRKNQTTHERKLWGAIRSKQILGIKFRRQYSVGEYILDFYSTEIKLCIEIDGNHHKNPDTKKYDDQRKKFLESCGIDTIRFSNNSIESNIESCLEEIERKIKEIRNI